jgi:hypothetical protein
MERLSDNATRRKAMQAAEAYNGIGQQLDLGVREEEGRLEK